MTANTDLEKDELKSHKEHSLIFEDVRVNVKTLLAALWVAIMFLFIYVDHFALFETGILEDLIAGELAGFPITQTFLLLGLALMAIPILMIFLSLALKARINRFLNLIVGIIYIVVVLGNMIGETWWFYIFGSVVEIVLLLLIVRYAWTWPRELA